MSDREVLVVAHTGRAAAVEAAVTVARGLADAGLGIRLLEVEADQLDVPVATASPVETAAEGVELVIAVGGDGTLLRAAELARPARAPLLGVNLGHVGFLAEAEQADLSTTVEKIRACDYDVEERLTLDFSLDGHSEPSGWALNDVTIEKASRERMLDVVVAIDERPLSRWGCDGIICATPTGSTAYAFSAGGPVVWPEVAALLLVPISAHALFARPLVISPDSVVTVETVPDTVPAVLFSDGRRTLQLPAGARVDVRRGHLPVRLVRLHRRPFTDRLVAKFGLPVHGWRGSPG